MQPVAENSKISPSLVFYLVIGMQIGIGILGFQRQIAKDAGYDAWISVLAAGLSVHVFIWMIYKITETADGDLVQVHEYIFGKKIAKLFSSLYILYACLVCITVLRTFIEIIQVWMFRDLSPFWFSLGYLILCIYIVFGGFRTVTGIAFFSIILPSYLIFAFAYPLPFSDITNIQPIFTHSFKEMTKAYYDMALTFSGFETLLFFYPFIKEPQKSKKWAHLAVLTTTIIYTVLTLLTFSYFAEKQLQETIWPTLNMWKIVELPFVERFEYIGIANWNLIILPNVCIPLWVASRLCKQIFHIRQQLGVIAVSIVCLVASSFMNTRNQILFLGEFSGKMSFLFIFVYIPFLLIAVMIAKKVKHDD
ncbi:spore germination protein AB [Neobacillus niacini]|uniref:GerAB/ArcD/ProY family transporter n=1 Tax=Neobacillus niacini TaxID=86668 RepID=UPI002780E330|nr:GerAB/ArcD/ProY family transporter [Neobacillus niacini]MDQ1000980.1 spore germination protein AB [Neobacillus niacini]